MIISLGGSCAVSHQIRKQKNNYTLPFDWTRISLKQLTLTLQNNFKNYSNVIIHKYSENHKSYILKNYYNVQFSHEVKKKYTISEFNKKLNNRIKKFNKILEDTNDEINFVRFETSPYYANYFSDFIELLNIIHIIKNKNCNINIKLILHKSYLNKLDFCNNKIKINLNNIKIYYYDDFNINWKYPNIKWTEILKL